MLLRSILAVAVVSMPAAALAQQPDPFGYEFDDYLCYDIPKSDWIKPHYRLDMADQFGETASEALKAMYICNPVKKQVSVEGKAVAEDGIRNERLHYMCYVFDPGRTNAKDRVFEVQNEFENGKYQAGGPRMICVPSLKRRLE